MKLISWNVNGIRACQKSGAFDDFFNEANADFFCLQETKLSKEIKIEKEGYMQFWNTSKRKGYSGTAIFCRKEPIKVEYGLKDDYGDEIDSEGRILTLEYNDFYLVNCYTPSSKNDGDRAEFRMKWDKCFRNYVSDLNDEKYVIMCGDFNVSHMPIDMCLEYRKSKNIPFDETERNAFSKLLKEGFIDTYRYFHPQMVNYSWWSCSDKDRAENMGWRLDYFLISEDLKKQVRKAEIHTKILGSDHCPIELELKI